MHSSSIVISDIATYHRIMQLRIRAECMRSPVEVQEIAYIVMVRVLLLLQAIAV